MEKVNEEEEKEENRGQAKVNISEIARKKGKPKKGEVEKIGNLKKKMNK